MKNALIILTFLLTSFSYLNGQVYINGGTNLSKIPTGHAGQENDIYALGYNLGLNYSFNITDKVSAKTGLLFVNRTDPKYGVSPGHGINVEGNDWLKQNQNILCIPIDIRTKVYKQFRLITGMDFNFLLKNPDTEFKNAIDPNLKVGASFEKDKWFIDLGYSFSVQPYASESIFDFYNKNFFLTFGYQIF